MPSRWRFDDKAGRFRGPAGRFIASSTVRSYLDRALDGHGREISRLAESLRDRTITLGQWERAMRVELKQIHLYSGMLALGGRAQLSPALTGRIGRELRDQYAFLRDFADDIASGKQAIDGRLAARARLYAQSGRVSFHNVERADMERRGFRFERNVLSPSDHCASCAGETAKGSVPIGSLKPIGARTCLANCRCRIVYERAAA